MNLDKKVRTRFWVYVKMVPEDLSLIAKRGNGIVTIQKLMNYVMETTTPAQAAIYIKTVMPIGVLTRLELRRTQSTVNLAARKYEIAVREELNNSLNKQIVFGLLVNMGRKIWEERIRLS